MKILNFLEKLALNMYILDHIINTLLKYKDYELIQSGKLLDCKVDVCKSYLDDLGKVNG